MFAMNSFEELIISLSKMLRATGYKKRRYNWYKNGRDVTCLFSIQKSQFTEQRWFLCFGASIHELHESEVHSAACGDVRFQVEQNFPTQALEADAVFRLIESWEKRYGSLELLKQAARAGRLPPESTTIAIRYLTSV